MPDNSKKMEPTAEFLNYIVAVNAPIKCNKIPSDQELRGNIQNFSEQQKVQRGYFNAIKSHFGINFEKCSIDELKSFQEAFKHASPEVKRNFTAKFIEGQSNDQSDTDKSNPYYQLNTGTKKVKYAAIFDTCSLELRGFRFAPK